MDTAFFAVDPAVERLKDFRVFEFSRSMIIRRTACREEAQDGNRDAFVCAEGGGEGE